MNKIEHVKTTGLYGVWINMDNMQHGLCATLELHKAPNGSIVLWRSCKNQVNRVEKAQKANLMDTLLTLATLAG